MKKLIFTILILTAFLSCKNDSKSENKEVNTSIESDERTEKQSDGLTLLKGDFVYHNGAAVLQTHAEIYGVLITDRMLELNKMAEAYKKDPTDMVSIEIRGKITNQKDEKILWENKLEIVEILNVEQPKEKENTIKIGQ